MKNHVRMASGDGHGDAGTVPDGYDDDLEAANDVDADGDDGDSDESDAPDDADDGVESEPTTVTPDDLEAAKDGDSDESDESDDGANYPFDPSDSDAIELDGGETVDIRKNGEIYPGVEAEAGDYLLRTDKGPVLYDNSEDELYEVVTA